MPIYEYKCRGCGHCFEALVRPPTRAPACPACQGLDLEQLLSAFAASTEQGSKAAFSSARRQTERAFANREWLNKKKSTIITK